MNTNQKLEQFAAREYRRNAHNIIVETQRHQHLVFGAYVLQQTDAGVELWNRAQDLVAVFSDQRSALSWCVADKFRRYSLSQQILNLDEKKQSLSVDIATQRALAARSRSAEYRDVVNSKLSNRMAQHRAVVGQLEKCINLAKYLQTKGFQNETARVFAH